MSTPKAKARQNLIAACIRNGCARADIEFHLESRAAKVAALREDRYERAAFFRSDCLPYTRQEHRWMREVSRAPSHI